MAIRIRDLLERFVWTVVAAALTNLVGVAFLDLDALQAAALSGINGAVTYLLVIARWRLSVLPDPGAGLPGLPTGDTVDIGDRLRGHAGQSQAVTVLVVVFLAIVILKLIGAI